MERIGDLWALGRLVGAAHVFAAARRFRWTPVVAAVGCLLVLCGTAFAQAPQEIEVPAGKFATIEVPFKASVITSPLSDFPKLEGRLLPVGDEYVLTLGGDCPRIELLFIGSPKKAGDPPPIVAVIATLEGAPDPQPPVPPGPTPGPDPPEPEPDPTPPAPIPVAGLHVLLIHETGDTLSPGQQAVLYGEQVRGYLDAKCQLYTDGSRAYRIYDKDVDVSADWTVWQDAMKRERKSLPWAIVSNGVTGYEGPLPESPEAMIDLLAKYEVGK